MAMHDTELLQKFSYSTCEGVREMFYDIKDKLSWIENETILDVGCGTGNVTANVVTQFVPSDSTIVATDISEEMINYGKKHYNNSKITYKILDITETNLWTSWKKAHFDKVFCFYVMQRIKDDRKAYSNMFDLLKPGGQVLLLFPIKNQLDEIWPFLAKMPKYQNYADELLKLNIHINPREDHVSFTRELLKSIGFDIILCQPNHFKCVIGSIDDLMELLEMVSFLSEILPKDLCKDTMDDAKKIVQDQKLLEINEEGFNVKYTTLVVIAKK